MPGPTFSTHHSLLATRKFNTGDPMLCSLLAAAFRNTLCKPDSLAILTYFTLIT
jgi:hypothetical protein